LDVNVNSKVRFEHDDVVEKKHRFPAITFRGTKWDLSHLDAFAMRIDPGLGFEVDVVFLFSCHCFTHSIGWDGRDSADIPPDELYDDEGKTRVLCEERYSLSQRLLRQIMESCRQRTIRFGAEYPQNFFTLEDNAPNPAPGVYAVFFEVNRDRLRKRRLLIQVQSAYRLEVLKKRLRNAGKVRFDTLLKAAYEGRVLRG
jgi:hypothetical protein